MNMAQQGQKIAGKNHLNIFGIVQLFKKEQAPTEVEIRQLMAGWEQKETGAPRRIKAIIDYLTALSYWVGKSI